MTKLGDKPVHHNGRGKFHPPQPIRMRPAMPRDLQAVSGICRQQYEKVYGKFTCPEAMDFFVRPFVYGALRKRVRQWQVLVAGNTVCGCIKLAKGSGCVILDKVYLAPGASGRRLGNVMLGGIPAGELPVVVQVYRPNVRAIRFFVRNGFSRQGNCRWSYDGRVQQGIQLIRMS